MFTFRLPFSQPIEVANSNGKPINFDTSLGLFEETTSSNINCYRKPHWVCPLRSGATFLEKELHDGLNINKQIENADESSAKEMLGLKEQSKCEIGAPAFLQLL